MADAAVSKTVERKLVWVRLPLLAPPGFPALGRDSQGNLPSAPDAAIGPVRWVLGHPGVAKPHPGNCFTARRSYGFSLTDRSAIRTSSGQQVRAPYGTHQPRTGPRAVSRQLSGQWRDRKVISAPPEEAPALLR